MSARLHIAPTEKFGLSRLEAAAFVGVTPSTFDAMVAAGEMPAARRLRNVDRWGRTELERAFMDMPESGIKSIKLSAYSDVA